MNIKPFPKKRIKDTLESLAKRGDHVTHGDLIIIRCDEKDLPENFKSLPDCKDGVLALGEFTGHAHKLEPVGVTDEPDLEVIEGEVQPLSERVVAKQASFDEMYLRVTEPVLLKHQEHDWYRLHPGDYEIGIQVERNPYDKQIQYLRD